MSWKILASVLVAASLGCAGLGAKSRPEEPPASTGHGYALLYKLLGQERLVSKLLIIKEERPALEAVIEAISETCGEAYDRLEDLAKENPRVSLTDTGLPAEEVKTREAIAATRRSQLLKASGREFELQLLWSQNEALTYGAHLAETLSRMEPNAERLEFIRQLWKDLTRLQPEVQALMRAPSKAGPS